MACWHLGTRGNFPYFYLDDGVTVIIELQFLRLLLGIIQPRLQYMPTEPSQTQKSDLWARNKEQISQTSLLTTLSSFYIHGSMHRNSILIRSNKKQQYAGIYLLQNYSTCFGCYPDT